MTKRDKVIVWVGWVAVCTIAALVMVTWVVMMWPARPTADQLFGCTWEQTDTATGECK